jgi:uncharacterized protein YsxB (DUF464 family)
MVVFVNVVCCQVDVSATGRSLVQRRPSECVCVCVSLSVITCNNNLLHLRRVRIRGQTKTERKEERKKVTWSECAVKLCYSFRFCRFICMKN